MFPQHGKAGKPGENSICGILRKYNLVTKFSVTRIPYVNSEGPNIITRWCNSVTGQECVFRYNHNHAAKSLQSCPTLCDPRDGSPTGFPVPGILQARTLEWVAISFSNVWKWSLSVMSDPQRPLGLQPTRLLRPWEFPGRSTGVECHCLLRK